MKREITSINFGDWVRMKRKEHNMYQTDLGAKIKCHGNSIGRWERGEDYPPLDIVEQIVKLFGAEIVIRESGYEKPDE